MAPLAQHSAGRPIVVVADDDDAVLNSIKFSLEIEGFAVLTFADGQTMLDGIDKTRCACIVLDQNMPGLTGIAAATKLRQQGVATPVILITTGPSEDLRTAARQRKIQVVEKPLLGNQLIDSIHRAIGQ